MSSARQSIGLSILLMGVACSSWYLTIPAHSLKLDEHTLSTTANIVMHNLTVKQFNNEGQLVHSLQTPLMRHIEQNNTHWFKNPYIVIAEINQPVWEIKANQATALYGGQQITFNKNVVLHQGKDAHNEESTLKTEAITYFPKKKIATTSLKVTYERPQTMIQSKGMKAYLAEKRVVLLSEARSRYEPKPG